MSFFLRKGNVNKYREADGCACDNIYKMEKNSTFLFLFESFFFIIRTKGFHNPYIRKNDKGGRNYVQTSIAEIKRRSIVLSGEFL